MMSSILALALVTSAPAQFPAWSPACPNGQCSAGVSFSAGLGASYSAPRFESSYYGGYAGPQFQPSYYGGYAGPQFQPSYYGGYAGPQFQPSYYGNLPIVRDSYSHPEFFRERGPAVIVIQGGGLLRRPSVYVLR